MPPILIKLVQNRLNVHFQGIDLDFTVNILDNVVANSLDPYSTGTEQVVESNALLNLITRLAGPSE